MGYFPWEEIKMKISLLTWYYLREAAELLFRIILFPVWYFWKLWKQIDYDFEDWYQEEKKI
jgi:hypothetical protein